MLPSNYVRVDYIESSKQQYIDTLFKPNNNTSIDITFQYLSFDSGTKFIYGANNGGWSSLSYGLATYSGSQGFYAYANSDESIGENAVANTRYRFNRIKNNITVYKNGTQTRTKTLSSSSFQCPYNLILFGVHWGSSVERFSNIRLYNCKIYDNDTLVRDFVPAKNTDTNELGLYDLVNDVFYTNQGTGTFAYGHEMPENIILEDNPLQTTLENDLSLVANFKIKYTITINYDETLGSASYSWGQGNEVLLSATPNSNVQFLGWYLDDTRFSTSLNTSYIVDGDTTFEARFEPIYEVNASVVGDGSIGFNRQSTDQNQVDFYVIPDENRHFVKYVVDGQDIFDENYSIRLNDDITIVAYFEEDDKFHISVSTNIDNGSVYVSNNDDYATYISTLWARPFPNYVFEKWSDGNRENPRTLSVSKNITLIAEYTHIQETNGIYQYRCYVKDQLDLEAPPKAFMVVDTFTLNEDYLTKANSTINVLELASNINNGDVIVVYNPKGETIYQGVITSTSDNKITTSQMQSFYKGLWIYKTNPQTYLEEELRLLFTEYAQGNLRGSSYTDTLVAQRLGGITIQSTNATQVNLPTDDNFTQYDMEQFIYKLYQDYGIIFDFTINFSGTNYVNIKVPTYSSISIGNNHYAIQNLSPIQTIEETNRLVIYSKDKVYRTTYVSTTNGIVEQPSSLANRFNITNTKVVFSDDSVDTLIASNLPTQMYNHKITFDLFLKNSIYEYKEFKLGMPLEIYYNGTDYYNSVLTSRSMSKNQNQNVFKVGYTCGLVRTTLTKKLTLNIV